MPFIKRINPGNANSSMDPRKIFIGRANELQFFTEHILEAEDPTYNIVSISGNGGVGKSTLLARFIDDARSADFKDYCLTALVDERQSTPVSIMMRFAQQLNELGFPLVEFEKALNRYKEALRKLQSERDETQESSGLRETVDLVGSVAESVVPVGKLLHKGANVITELYLKDQHTRQLLKDAEKLEDPISDLTEIFVEELNGISDIQVIFNSKRTKRRRRILLFFDTFEQLAAEATPWLLDYFLQANISSNIVLIVAGRDSIERSIPDETRRWLPYRDNGVIYLISLESFTEGETRSYLAERGITDPQRIATIWQLSGGLPLYLSLLTFNLHGNVDPTADVVDNFLRWIPKQESMKRRLALDAALFSMPFNQDDLAAFTYLPQVEDERTDLYHWLVRLPFVKSDLQGRYIYHELARELFSRHLFQQSQKEYYATRRALIDYYRQVLEQVQVKESIEAYNTRQWLELILALAYQLFLLPDKPNHFVAAEQVLEAYEHTRFVGEIIRVLRELLQEAHANQCSPHTKYIAKHLLEYIEVDQANQGQELLIAANNLLEDFSQASSFPKELLSRIYFRRSRANRRVNDYQGAIADCDHALELDPEYATIYDRRGTLYREMGEYERAIADYDRALELDSKLPVVFHNRGVAYKKLNKYERAIADYDRALELDQKMAIAYNSRGNAYRELNEYQSAIADYDHALERDPKFTPAYLNLGITYSLLDEYQQAITNFNRAIELDPSKPQAFASRGFAYLWLKQVEQAIADLTRCWMLDQTNISISWILEWAKMCQRGIDSESLSRLKAIAAADPEHYTGHICRGVVSWLQAHFEEAELELEQAISINPKEWDAYFWKGLVCAYSGHYSLAIEALERAVAEKFPPILLTPLRWLKKDRPDFYEKYIDNLLARYNG